MTRATFRFCASNPASSTIWHEVGQIHRGHFRYGRCIQPCKGEQPADHLIEAHQVGFHVIEREVAGFALSRQIESDIQSCERRPQFVGPGPVPRARQDQDAGPRQ